MLTLRRDTVHVWYLDASALVKLVVDEGDHMPVRLFYNTHPAECHATSLCLMEALGVLKAKWDHSHISHDEYLKATRKLIIDAWSKQILPDSVDLYTPQGLKAVEALAQKHNLDLSDALQLETLLNGTYKYFARDSRPILITADAKLAAAARRENIRVWNCSLESPPVEV